MYPYIDDLKSYIYKAPSLKSLGPWRKLKLGFQTIYHITTQRGIKNGLERNHNNRRMG